MMCSSQPMLRDAVAALEDAHLARKFGYVTFGSQDDQDRRLSLRYNTVLNIKNKQPNKDHFAAMPKLQRKDGMPQTPPCDGILYLRANGSMTPDSGICSSSIGKKTRKRCQFCHSIWRH